MAVRNIPKLFWDRLNFKLLVDAVFALLNSFQLIANGAIEEEMTIMVNKPTVRPAVLEKFNPMSLIALN